jgi:hypothetical protein
LITPTPLLGGSTTKELRRTIRRRRGSNNNNVFSRRQRERTNYVLSKTVQYEKELSRFNVT